MRLASITAVAAAAFSVAACAPAAAQSHKHGYLAADAAPDTVRLLPPPPAPGSAADEADRKLFARTRALKGSERWKLAQNDAHKGRILDDMACAVGARLDRRNAPRTTALLAGLQADVKRAVDRPKDFYKKRRPYLAEGGPTCDLRIPGLATPDYPSGHASFGWSVGLVLAQVAPDRREPILQRARAFGESRIVCGVHTRSAVEAGRLNAQIVVAALDKNPAFRSDLEAARREVAAARAAGPRPDPAACARQAALIAQPID